MRKKVDSRIVISTNGVTRILLPRALRVLMILEIFYAVTFYSVTSHVWNWQCQIHLWTPHPKRNSFFSRYHRKIARSSTLSRWYTRNINVKRGIQIFPFTCSGFLVFYRYSLILIKSLCLLKNSPVDLRRLESANLALCKWLLGYGFR